MGNANTAAAGQGSIQGGSGKDPLVSHHVFLLPFKWQLESAKAYRTHQFAQLTEKFLQPNQQGYAKGAPQWKRHYFTQDRIADYNEHHYFYDYVTEILYEKKRPKRSGTFDEHFIAHYEYDIEPGRGSYQIVTPDPHVPGKKKTFILEIDSVLLHLYYTGVGILSFHLNNRIRGKGMETHDQSTPEDIIAINQYGRRVYPNFYSIPSSLVGYQSSFDEKDFLANRANGKELAYSITIKLPNKSGKDRGACETWDKDFTEQLRSKDNHWYFKLPEILKPFLLEIDQKYFIFPVLDDRMFVVSWYGNTQLARKVSGSPDGDETDYESDDWWYRYVFVDGKYKTVHSDSMQKQLITKATYCRWQNYKSMYGVSEYSLVLLTQDLKSLVEDNEAFLVTHLQTIYYRLAELVLLQRACVQRFSDDITHISRLDGSSPRQQRLAADLNQRYIRFVNRIHFREATPQQQGIEIYDLLHRQSRVPEQIAGLQEEIERLQAYIDQQQGQQLTALATLFVAPSLLLSAFALADDWPPCIHSKYGFSVLVAFLAAGMSYFTFRRLHRVYIVLLIIVFFLLLFSPWLYCQLVESIYKLTN